MTTTASTLVSRLSAALTPIFEEEPLYVSDSSELVDWMAENGCDVHFYNQKVFASLRDSGKLNSVVAMFTGRDTLPNNREWNDIFRSSKVLQVPFLSFDGSFKAASYTVEQMSYSDYATAVEMNRDWLSRVATVQESLRFQGHSTEFTCELDDEANLLAPKIDADLQPGEWVSIGSYTDCSGRCRWPRHYRPSTSLLEPRMGAHADGNGVRHEHRL